MQLKNIEEIKKDFVTLWDKHLLYNIWNKMYKREIIEKGFFEISNVDYNKFVICSDGVSETISLVNFIRIDISELNDLLEKNSKDNYTYIYGFNKLRENKIAGV